MANGAFQPILQGGRANQVPQTPIPGIDFSGAFNAIGNVLKNRERERQQAEKMAVIQDTADLQSGLIGLQQERLRGNLQEQEITANLQELRNDGIIDEDQVEDFNRIQKQLDSLKQFRRQGLGNDTVFQIRKNALFRQALANNPLISSEINTLFNGDISDPESSAQTTAQAQISQTLDQRHGPGWGIREFERYKKEQAMLANYETNKTLGAISATNVTREIPTLVNTGLKGWVDELRTALGAGDVLSVEEESYFERKLQDFRATAYQEVNDLVERAQQQGNVLTPAQVQSLQDRVDDEISFYSQMMTEKDLGTRSRLLSEVYNRAVDLQMPSLMRHAKNLGGGEGGAGNLSTLLTVLNDDGLKRVAGDAGMEWLNKMEVESDEAIAQVFDFLVSGVEIQDPGLRDIADVVSMSVIKKSPDSPAQVKEDAVNVLDEATNRDNLPEGDRNQFDRLSGNIVDAAQTLNSKNFARNLTNELSDFGKNKLKVMTRNWVSTAMSKAQQDMANFQGDTNLIYDAETDQFMAARRDPRQMSPAEAERFARTRPVEAAPVSQSANLLNNLLDLADNPALQNIVPTKEQIINRFMQAQKQLEEEIQGLQEEEDRQSSSNTQEESEEDRTRRERINSSPARQALARPLMGTRARVPGADE